MSASHSRPNADPLRHLPEHATHSREQRLDSGELVKCEVLNLPKAARRLGVTAKWLRDQAETGAVPSLKAGRQYLFDWESLQAALAYQARNTDEERQAFQELARAARRLQEVQRKADATR